MKKAVVPFAIAATLGLLSATPRVPVSTVAFPAAQRFAPYGELDCNGYSPIQRPLAPLLPCADLSNDDNEHYIGHDEPEAQFYSNAPGSGNDVQWVIRLPLEHSLPSTQTFQNEIAFWLGMVLCDPNSIPGNPCKPDSDTNGSGIGNPRAAGAAFLEMQFYPPGLPPAPVTQTCDSVHWCAAMAAFSLMCKSGFTFCNRKCEEPLNFAFIARDGVPAGPPGPGSATIKTFTPNAQTLLMNQGDLLRITIKDSPEGLVNAIEDLTTGQKGYMVASERNGFQHLDLKTCKAAPFAFHPEFDTAKSTNALPWSLGIRNIAYAAEIGHFEHRDGDKDDKPCFTGPVVPGCLGADLDFDGDSYLPDWPDGSTNTPNSVLIESALGNGIGPVGYSGGRGSGFTSMRFVTGVPASEETCQDSLAGCTLPPPGAKFYPFYAISASGNMCQLTFGNRIAGMTTNDFDGVKQYGGYDTSVPFTFQGKEIKNPCIPH